MRFQETIDRFEQRGFADAVGAQDGSELAGFGCEAKPAQDMQIFVVADVEVLYLEPCLVFLVMAKIGVDHGGITLYRLRLAIGDQCTVMKHEQTLAQFKNGTHIMTDQYDSFAVVVNTEYVFVDRLLQTRVHAGKGLVQNYD